MEYPTNLLKKTSGLKRVLFLMLFSICFSNVLNAQNTLFYLEDFNVDGEGTSYTRSHIFDTIGSFFKPGTTATFLGAGFTPTNIQNNRFLAMQNPDNGDLGGAAAGPSDGICTLTIKDLIISNYDTVFLSYYLAAQNSQIYGPFRFANSGHWMNMEYQINSGAWTIVSRVRNANKSVFTPLYHTRGNVSVASASLDTVLTSSFREFRDTIPNAALGDTLRVRFVFKGNDGAKMIALDKIRMRGQLVSALPNNRVRLLFSYCGYNTNNLNSNIFVIAEDGSPESYEYEISGGDLGSPQTVIKSNASINLTEFSGLNYGQIYNLRVRGIFGGSPGVYSDTWFGTCQISIDTSGPEMATPCGTTRSLFENLSSEQMGGATNYRFRINGGTEFTTGGNRFFTLDAAGFSSNGSYTVEPAAFINGAWTNYSSICTYNVTNGAPTISLIGYQSGRTYNNLNSSVWTVNVANATNYQWSITGGLTQTVSTGTRNYLTLSDIPGIAYGVSPLSIRVRVTVAAVTGVYGTSCSISIGSGVPSPEVKWVCGTAIDSTKVINCEIIGNATTYLFTISGGYDTTIARNVNSFSFDGQLPSLNSGSYNIQARAIIGTDTSALSSICSVTLNSGARIGSGSKIAVLNRNQDYQIFPNPVRDILYLKSPFDNSSTVILYDLTGKIVRDEVFVGNTTMNLRSLPAGQYQMRVWNENLSAPVFSRIIKE